MSALAKPMVKLFARANLVPARTMAELFSLAILSRRETTAINARARLADPSLALTTFAVAPTMAEG